MSEVRLRILATSDLHLQLLPFDYVRDESTSGASLSKLSTLVKEARAQAAEENRACFLFDNGDTFQGTPVGDFIAQLPLGTTHPAVACMTAMGYTAGGLGNHDFDHGLDQLSGYLSQHQIPVLCSNLSSDKLPMVRTSHMINLAPETNSSRGAHLKIGVLSSLPEKTALWNRQHLENNATFLPPLQTLEREAEHLREQGADLIIVLAHMGLALFDEGAEAQNLVSEVAALRDVDVVIGGHTHLRFPGPDHAHLAEADCVAGIVNGKPVVQPGASASDLGVVDLTLSRSQERAGWRIMTSDVQLRHVTQQTEEDPEIVDAVAAVHAQTRQYLSHPVARLNAPMNSYFSLVHPSPVTAMLAAAKCRAIARDVAASAYANLPLLAAASAPLSGGFDGPENFIALERGEVRRSHVAGMNPYANHVWAVKTTGAQLFDWLERSALIFNQLNSNDRDQMLLDPRVPGFRFDTIYGLTYRIDPSKPAMFDPGGRCRGAGNGRVKDVKWNGAPLLAEQEFLVATTDHRAGGGGLYKTFGSGDIVVQGQGLLQDALTSYLECPDDNEIHRKHPWSLESHIPCSAILLTSPEAIHHLEDIAHLQPEACGETADGFLRLRLHF